MMDRVEDEAVKAKNQALLWIYAIEWLVVTGTLMIGGFILWSLMVRRKLYREVDVSRVLIAR